MKLELGPGEHIEIVFEDIDGRIIVAWNKGNGIHIPSSIIVHTDVEDSTFGRKGVIYKEEFGLDTELSNVDEEVKNDE